MGTVEHPRIRPGTLEDRTYQATIATAAVDHNTLVVLPTGLGKTAIALRVAAEWLLRAPTKSILLLAPTRPLVAQHAQSVRDVLLAPPITVLTGTISPEQRATRLVPPQVVVATPQVIANDLGPGVLSLRDFSLLIFDEAHRAVGEYPYAAIGQANQAGPRARVLAMTASPGSKRDRIQAVWANLGIERFEYRTASDPDVTPYVHAIGVTTIPVAVPPEVQELAIRLRATIARQTAAIVAAHFFPDGTPGSRRDYLALGAQLRGQLDGARRRGDQAPAAVWAAVTAQSTAMKALHALELVESQGVDQLRSFLAEQRTPRSGRVTPAQRRFLTDPDVVRVEELLAHLTVDLPKIARSVEIVREELHRNPGARVILFTQYRDTADAVVRALQDTGDPSLHPARFVGQGARAGDAGLTQKEQSAVLDRFRAGQVNCLVATSVAEEGLDVPSTDLVIFYEPVPDVIRTIQRRGRTGRAHEGRAVVLVSEGTRDVGLARSAGARERRMHAMLAEVEEDARRGTLPPPTPVRSQSTLFDFG